MDNQIWGMMKDENRDWNREKGKTNSPSRGPEPKNSQNIP